jgi:hypothetical protein
MKLATNVWGCDDRLPTVQGGTAVRLGAGRLASHVLGSRGKGEIETCFETSRSANQAATEWVKVKVEINLGQPKKVNWGSRGIALLFL